MRTLDQMTDGQLRRKASRIRAILEARKAGTAKKEATAAELLELFRANHAAFVAVHKAEGGLTSRSPEVVRAFVDGGALDEDCPVRMRTVLYDTGESPEDGEKGPYFSVAASVESGRSNMKFTAYDVECTFDWENLQFVEGDGWESDYLDLEAHPDAEYILEAYPLGSGVQYQLADFLLVRLLAKKLGLA
jgi:hypothetical protein